MEAKESSKHCTACGLLKPLSAFVVGRNKTGQLLYGTICQSCRQAHTDDTEESGGKQRGLAITHEDRDLLAQNQNKQEEELAENLKDYIEEQDKTEAEKETNRQENSALRRAINNAAKRPSALFSKKQAPTAIHFNPDAHPDPNVSDPFKQKAAAHAGEAHAHAAHQDRMDVKNIQNSFFGDQTGSSKAHGARVTDSSQKKRTSGMFKAAAKNSQAEEVKEVSSITQFIKGRWGR